MILDWFFKKRGVRKDIEIEVATPESGPMPVAGEDVASMINRSLDRKGIELKPGAAVTAVTGRGRMMEYSNGDRALVDLAITIPHHRMASLVADSPLIGDHGWVKVNPRTLETDHPGVFAIGDINAVPMAAGRGIPKAGVFAVSEGEIVGTNIAADINGTPTVDFPGDGYCFIGFSGEISASVKGNFTDPTGPKVMISRPSSRGMRAKERFERDWKRFRLS
jgi:sulfide:quinone oxidoreductase